MNENITITERMKDIVKSLNRRAEIDLLLRTLPEKTKKIKALEMGCSVGFIIRTLKSKFQDWEIYGVDLNKESVRRASNSRVFLSNAEKTPFKKEDFDLVYSVVFYYGGKELVDTKKWLKEIDRVLKNGGHFLCVGCERQVKLILNNLPKNFTVEKIKHGGVDLGLLLRKELE